MSETHDPWKDVELGFCGEDSYAVYSAHAVDAARAAEATQHQQALKFYTDWEAESSAQMDEISARVGKTAGESVAEAVERFAADTRARLAAVEAERDAWKKAWHANAEAVTGEPLVVPTVHKSLTWAMFDDLTAERDRLKAALEAAQPFVVDTYRRGGRVGLANAGDVIEQVAAALSGEGTKP